MTGEKGWQGRNDNQSSHGVGRFAPEVRPFLAGQFLFDEAAPIENQFWSLCSLERDDRQGVAVAVESCQPILPWSHQSRNRTKLAGLTRWLRLPQVVLAAGLSEANRSSLRGATNRVFRPSPGDRRRLSADCLWREGWRSRQPAFDQGEATGDESHDQTSGLRGRPSVRLMRPA